MESHSQNRRSRRPRHRDREMMDLQRQERHRTLARRQQQDREIVFPSSNLRRSPVFSTMSSLLWTPREIAPFDIFLISAFFSVPLSHLVTALGELFKYALVFLFLSFGIRLYSRFSITPASQRILREFREVRNHAQRSFVIGICFFGLWGFSFPPFTVSLFLLENSMFYCSFFLCLVAQKWVFIVNFLSSFLQWKDECWGCFCFLLNPRLFCELMYL